MESPPGPSSSSSSSERRFAPCAMSGGGGGGGGADLAPGMMMMRMMPGPGAITLEDLERMSASEEEEEEEEAAPAAAAAEEEEERLLRYWQRVGRGHRVDVPNDMAEPIQQLTTNNHLQERESVPFTLITHKEKFGEVLYEKRRYETAKWACVKVQEEQYEQSICLGFMKIMKYICQQNSSGSFLGMTVPIVTIVHLGENSPAIMRSVTVAYHLPRGLQEQPPQPYDPEISIEEWPPAIIYARGFRGVTNEDSIAREINLLADLLERPEMCWQDTFIVAGYTNPAATNRQNEIWFLERP